MRQENDRRILDLCNDIRVGTVSSEDLELLITRNIANFPNTAFADTVRVVPRNAIANQYKDARGEDAGAGNIYDLRCRYSSGSEKNG